MDTLQSRLLTATQTLNDLTGYSSIDKIRLANDRLERQLADAQSRLRDARASYKSLVSHRAATQREVNTLLARKDAWSPPDVERFTALYRSEHELESRVADATRELTEAEAEELRVGTALTTGILRRYHEEQVWSDRIRRASTWGTWGLMGVNVLLFIGLQVFAEPWKRKKLVERFSEAERGLWEEVRREVGEVRGLLMEARANSAGAVEEEEEKEAVLSVTGGETAEELPSAAETVAVNTTEMPPVEVEALRDWEWWQAVILDPHRWQGVVEDLYSERRIDLRMRDATVLALEGALAGAAVAAGVVFMLLKRS
jgi:sensitive to high expression protein 9